MIPMVFPSSISAHGDDGCPDNADDCGAAFHAGACGWVFAPATRVRHDAGDAHRDYGDAHVAWLREAGA